MIVLCHRGCWTTASERNAPTAIQRAFELGLGIETDLRDRLGEVVVSHDIPVEAELTVDELFDCYNKSGLAVPIALNIKADGLADLLFDKISYHGISNYFFFDMSVPDMLAYAERGLVFYTRVSEIEAEPTLYDEATGIWLDAFYSEWYTMDQIAQFLEDGKKVCLVSPELHGRDHRPLWSHLLAFDVTTSNSLMLCTDFPKQAVEFFDIRDRRP